MAKTKAKTSAKKPAKARPAKKATARAKKPAASAKKATTARARKPATSPEPAKSPGHEAVVATPATEPTRPGRRTKQAPAGDATLDALLAEVRRNPDDDQARLIYADALSERGDPRGTFISHHYQLADIDRLDERHAPLLASTLRLEAQHVGAWLDGLAAVSKVKPDGWVKLDVDRTANAVFERGFLRRVAVSPEFLAATWAWVSAREPIAGVELLVGEGLSQAEYEMPCAESFRVLKVSTDGWFTAHSVGRVLAWGLPHVRDLDLSGCDLGAGGAQLLANEPTDHGDYFDDWKSPPPFARGQLRRLILYACQLGDEGARLLAKAETLDGIAELDVGQCRLRERETLEALRASPHLQSLVRLSIAGNRDLAGQLDALAGWEVLGKLDRLALPASVSAAEVAALYPAPSARLRELDLSAAKEALAQPAAVLACAEALTHLDIGSTSLGDASWSRLVEEPCAARVLDLRANGCSLSDAAIRALVKSPMRRLVRLDISSNKLTDAGIAELAAWDGLAHVAWLRIGNNRKLTAAAYRALIASPHLALAMLDVGKGADGKSVAALRERFGDGVRAS